MDGNAVGNITCRTVHMLSWKSVHLDQNLSWLLCYFVERLHQVFWNIHEWFHCTFEESCSKTYVINNNSFTPVYSCHRFFPTVMNASIVFHKTLKYVPAIPQWSSEDRSTLFTSLFNLLTLINYFVNEYELEASKCFRFNDLGFFC